MSPQNLTDLQRAVDETVTTWPGVHGKQVFGHRGWVKGGSMLGFAADEGISVRAVDGAMSTRLYAIDGVVPFSHGAGMEMTGWPVLPLRSDDDLERALNELRRVYESL